MPILIVASSEPRAGRSLIAAALAWRIAREGAPVTLARLAGGDGADRDARIFASIDGLGAPATPLTPDDLRGLENAVVEAPAGPASELAGRLGARVIGVAGYQSPPVDASGDALAGVVLTRVPASEAPRVRGRAGVIAILPEDPLLGAPSVADIAAALGARWLTGQDAPSSVGGVMIGTISSDAASPYFGNRARTCVITRFDKTDVQLAALQTDLACLVLTGGGQPSPYLLDRVLGSRSELPVLLAGDSTVECVRRIEGLFGSSPFDGEAKLARAVELLDGAGAPVFTPAAAPGGR